jgi:hypothetical protein
MHDQEATPSGRSLGALIVYGMAVAFFIYFGFFAAIFFDEIVFRTHWIHGTIQRVSPDFNETISQAVRVIYAPLIWIVKHLGGIP